jgi:hypothetical protein
MDPLEPADAQRVVAAYLKVVEDHATEEVYPGRLRDLPYSKDTIRTAFRTSTLALIGSGQLTPELRDYLEIGYVSLADYVEDEFAALLRDYGQAGAELAADPRPTRDKATTEAWQRVTAGSRLAGEIARAISAEANRLRLEFQSWTQGACLAEAHES